MKNMFKICAVVVAMSMTSGLAQQAGCFKSWDAEAGVYNDKFSLDGLKYFGWFQTNCLLFSKPLYDLWVLPEIGFNKDGNAYAATTFQVDTDKFSIPVKVIFDQDGNMKINLSIRIDGTF